ncbi:MAG: hypothetical protein IKK33_01390 [Lachnospiraceae bacterium]|nr:hypothetical protein [Lachnospiraceae bacterium]
MKREYIEKITDADLILVGIGKEFETNKYQTEERAIEALQTLKEHLEGKNYYVITVCTNSILKQAGFPAERIVCPCGNVELKQCTNKCDESLQVLTIEDRKKLEKCLNNGEEPRFGQCPVCGKDMVLNNVYASQYDENGYLENWKLYTKWLQGTLNKKLCVLELGMDLTYPSIIRWPFEKVAYYNQKAVFFRVNADLYHMAEELKDKGLSIAENSIDWLLEKDI